MEPDAPDRSGLALSEAATAWISIAEASHIFSVARMARNRRTIRRYCERGDLECRKTENALHQPQYFIDPKSVSVYIEQQRTLLDASRDMSGPIQTDPDIVGQNQIVDDAENLFDVRAVLAGPIRTSPGQPGQGRSADVLAAQLAERLRDKDEEIAFLRGELLHRRTTDTALHDVIAAFRANAEAQRLSARQQSPDGQGTTQQGM